MQITILFIHEHLFDTALTIQKIREKGYGKNHNFSTEFRNYTGVAPKDYVQQFRVEAGKMILCDERFESLQIYEIAKALGYRVSTFSHAFKKRVNDPPDKWRKEQLKTSKGVTRILE
ncbi:MAG: AraC family transcriptional regulator [Balneolaceae bacterium]